MCYKEQNRYSCGCEEKGEKQACIPKMADKQQKCAGPSKKTLILPFPCKKCRGETWLKRLEGKVLSRNHSEKSNDREAQETVSSNTHEGVTDTKKSSGESTLAPARGETTKDILIPSINIDTSFSNTSGSNVQSVNTNLRPANTKQVNSEYAEWVKRRSRFSWTPSVDISEYVTKKKIGLVDDTESSEQTARDDNDHPFYVSGALPIVGITTLTSEETENEVHLGHDEELVQSVLVSLDDIGIINTSEKGGSDNVNEHIQAASSTQANKILTAIKGAKKVRGGGAVLKALFRRLLNRTRRLQNNGGTGYIRLRGNNAGGSKITKPEDHSANAASQETAVNKLSCEASDKDQEFAKNKCWPEAVKPVYTVDKDDASF